MSHRWIKHVSVASLIAATPALLGATSLTNSFQERVLAAQNRERAALGIEPLSWNDGLALSAQSWAKHLAQTGAFEHAPEDRVAPEGENLWAGSKGYYSVEGMVNGWLDERRFFKIGRFPANSVTGRHEDVGHYTQVIWRRTHLVGCALESGVREDYLVCRYAEAGNYVGELPF